MKNTEENTIYAHAHTHMVPLYQKIISTWSDPAVIKLYLDKIESLSSAKEKRHHKVLEFEVACIANELQGRKTYSSGLIDRLLMHRQNAHAEIEEYESANITKAARFYLKTGVFL